MNVLIITFWTSLLKQYIFPFESLNNIITEQLTYITMVYKINMNNKIL